MVLEPDSFILTQIMSSVNIYCSLETIQHSATSMTSTIVSTGPIVPNINATAIHIHIVDTVKYRIYALFTTRMTVKSICNLPAHSALRG